MPLQIPTVQTGLEASIQAAARKAGKSMKIGLGANSKSIEALSQPLGRITGKADEFTKSMEAANARVLAFGASVGVLAGITRAFKELVTTTIAVEKSLANINSILNVSAGQLGKFKKEIFDVARNTEQTFDTVAQAALDLSRQGLKAEEVTNRLNDAMILARLSGLGASEAVSGLTAAINSFNREGLTSEQVLNKIAAAAVSAAVSERDLIEGIKRSGSVAIEAGVSFDELVGVISALQQKTARGGSVIGNSLKTIFTRLQSLEKLKTMQELGTEITDAAGAILPATKLIENLAISIRELPDTRKLQIAENLVGKFQIAPFLALLSDYNSKTQTAIEVTRIAAGATNEAYTRNIALSKTLSAAINQATVSLKELANMLGEIGVTDSLKNILGFFNSLVGSIKGLLEGEGLGGDFARGIVKGIGGVISGPGLAIFAAIIAKLTLDLTKFGTGALKTFFGMNKAAKEIAVTQGAIASSLLKNSDIQKQILAIERSSLSAEEKKLLQTKFFTTALNEQLAVMQKMQMIAGRVAPGVMAGTRSGRGAFGRGAAGYVPNFNASVGYGSESADIKRGVGGAPSSARPVTIPNFNFGSGQRGTMVANSSEFVVPNFAAGGSAIFNQEMVKTMGMPSGAKSLAAGGYIPNFVRGPGAAHFLQAAGIRNMKAFNKMPRAGAGLDSRVVGGQTISPQAAKNALARQTPTKSGLYAGGKGKPQRLVFPANLLGVASLFPSAQSAETRTSFQALGATAQANAVSAFPGIQNQPKTEFVFTGLNIRTLEDLKIKMKTEQDLRAKLKDFFLQPLLQFGNFLGGKTGLQNDELSSLQVKQSQSLRDPDIFNTSVQGGLFEAAIRLVTKGIKGIPDFDPLTSKTEEMKPFDFEETTDASPQFKKMWGFRSNLQKADAKRTASPENVRTLIGKSINNPQIRAQMARRWQRTRTPTGKLTKGAKAADGYIPNFAANTGALQESVAREEAAGLPINQIRINQDASLRNAGNPMGLAVTNIRDEPTGAIGAAGGYVPNYAEFTVPISKELAKDLKRLGKETKVVTKSAGGMSDKMIGAMFAASMLSGAFSNSATATGQIMEQFGKTVMNTSMALMALSMLPAQTTTAMGGFGKSVAKAGVAIVVASQAVKFFEKMLSTSESSVLSAAKNTDLMAAAAGRAAIKLNMLGAGGRAEAQARSGNIVRSALKSSVSDRRGAGAGGISGGLMDVVMAITGNPKLAKGASVGRGMNWRESSTEAIGRLGEWATGDFGQKRGSMKGTNIFEGFGDKQKIEQLLSASDVAISAGATGTSIQEVMRGIFEEGGTKELKTEKQFLDAMKALTDFTHKFTPEKVGRGLDKVLGESGGARLVGLQDFAEDTEVGDKKTERENKVLTERKRIIKELKTLMDINDIAAGAALDQRLNAVREIGDVEEKAAKAEEKRIATTKAIGLIENAGVLLKARLNVVSAVEKELEMAKALGNVSRGEMETLQTKVELRKVDEKSLLATHAAMEKVAKLTQEVTADQEKAADFADRIKNLTFEQVNTDEKRRLIIKEIAEATGVSTAKIENQVQLILKGVNANEKFLESERAKIKTAEEFNRLKRVALDLQKAEILQAQNLLNTQAENNRRVAQMGLAGIDVRAAQRGVGGPFTTLEQESQAVSAAKDQIERAKKEASAARSDIVERGKVGLFEQIGTDPDKAAALVQALKNVEEQTGQKFGARGAEATIKSLGGVESASVRKEALTQSLLGVQSLQDMQLVLQHFKMNVTNLGDDFVTDSTQAQKLGLELDRTANSVGDTEQKLIALGLVALQVAEGMGGILSVGQLAENKALAMKRGETQQQFEMELTADPFARAKQRVALESLGKRADAIATENFALNRQLEQADEMRYIMIDGASQFADKLGSAMSQAIRDGGSFGDALKSAGSTFLDYISDAMFKMAAQQMVGGLMGGGGGGILKSLFGGGGMASGGPVTGGSGRRDDVPAMLTGGEFVMNKGAVANHGVGFMKQLNEGRVQGFASGGAVMNQRDLLDPAFSGKAIRGKRDLMGFAKQGVTSGSRDFMRGGGSADGAFGAVALQPGSIRGTQFQRRTDRVAQGRTEARTNALNLYFQQLDSEKSRQEQWDAEQQRLLEERIREAEEGRKRKAQEAQQREAERKAKKSRIWGYIGGALGFMVGGPMGYAVGSTLGSTASGMATGGRVPYSAGVDRVPSMLSGGEFVMNAAATQRIGEGNLTALNGGVGGSGGDSAVVEKLQELINVSEGGQGDINITVNSDGTENTEGGGRASQSAMSLAARIRDSVTEILEQEKRLGGTLRTA